MPKAIVSIPLSPYHNLPAGDLADQLGSVKAEMGLPWYDAHCRQSSVTTVSVKPLAAVAAAKLAA